MLSDEEWRRILGSENLTDDELKEFVQSLRGLIGQFLDEYFRDEFRDDEV